MACCRLAGLALAVCLMAGSVAWGQELPQFPKVAPPQSLPEPICDTAHSDGGDWLLGKWVAPQARWEFGRAGGALTWALEQKGDLSPERGWRDGARLSGAVERVSACSVGLSGGEGRFSAEGVLTDSGRLFLIATNPEGAQVRYLLRRER